MISTNDIRALELYELALSLVEAKGTPVSGSTIVECRAGKLTIHYSAKTGHLEVNTSAACGNRPTGPCPGSADLDADEGVRVRRVRGADPRRRARQQPSLSGVDGLLTG